MRRSRLCLSFVVLALLVTGRSRSADLDSALQVPPLESEQRKLDDIHIWNGQVVVEAVGDGPRFNVVSLDTESVTPLKCPTPENSAASSASTTFIAVLALYNRSGHTSAICGRNVGSRSLTCLARYAF